MRKRYRLIDKEKLLELLEMENHLKLRQFYTKWFKSALTTGQLKREPQWTESVAVGREIFIDEVKARLKGKAIYKTKQKIC